MKLKRTWSLRLRVSVFFAALLCVAWAVAALFSWRESVEHIDTFFDTQQMLFAKRLASAQYAPLMRHLPDTHDMLTDGRGDEGEQEDDALAFAVFSHDGRLLLSDGEEGKNFVFTPDANGFVNTCIDNEQWRIVWLTSVDRHVIVAVGQELEYRDDMALEMLGGQMLPWLALLPVLLIGLTWMLGRELAPLHSVAANLQRRAPNDVSPITTDVHSEIRPLVNALNSLFARIGDMIQRERGFIANAAHELRTPLAGLSIQAQVAHSARQPETRAHALSQLRKGIDRTSRLVDQLLVLFKVESLGMEMGRETNEFRNLEQRSVRWSELLRTTLDDLQGQAEAKGLAIALHNETEETVIKGQPELLYILLSNIIGNAVKYTPENGAIDITLQKHAVTVQNSSRDLAVADVARLGERFFRPPGQGVTGSGLGLSIAKRIADLHGVELRIDVSPGLFTVIIGL